MVDGLVALMQESYVEIPAERRDLVEELSTEVSDLEDQNLKLEEQIIAMENEQKGNECVAHIDNLTESFTDTQKEAFTELVEDLDVDDVETFKRKADILLSKFSKNLTESKDENNSEDEVTEENDDSDSDDTISEDLKAQSAGDYGSRIIELARKRM